MSKQKEFDAAGALQKAADEIMRTREEILRRDAEFEQTREELQTAREAIDATTARLADVREERDETRGRLDETQSDLRESQGALGRARIEITETQAELAAAQSALETACAERDKARAECDLHCETIAQTKAELAAQAEQNSHLSAELMELYRDLRAEDLPTLILRIGMNVTGAENALYVDAAKNETIAGIALDNLKPEVRDALYEFTRRAAESEEPIVCNVAEELPDGAGLVNLAALPVAVQGDIKGVMLVANKRSGDFSDDDTDLLLSIGNHAGIAMENNRLHCALAEAYVSTIAALADAIEAKDPYTRGHCESVAGIAVEVAQKLGWNQTQIDHIRYAALLHDVGKIGIPDGILLKPGRLLPEEYQVIQRHASIGSDLVSRVAAMSDIAPIILHHHERVDGTGYPDGQTGDDISLASRIIGVVDAFDAMTTPRPYREAVAASEALEELKRCAGKQFDEYIVDLVGEVLAARAEKNETLLQTA